MRIIDTIKIEGATAATVSTVFDNNECDLCTVQVFGTATAMQVKIQGLTDTDSEDWQDIAFFDLTDLSLTEGDDGITETGVYEASIAGLTQVRLNLISVTGTISATAAFTNTSAT